MNIKQTKNSYGNLDDDYILVEKAAFFLVFMTFIIIVVFLSSKHRRGRVQSANRAAFKVSPIKSKALSKYVMSKFRNEGKYSAHNIILNNSYINVVG